MNKTYNNILLGAIVGDIAGSLYEFNKTKDYNFEMLPLGSHFTDDSLLTIAIANAVLTETSYLENIVKFGLKYYEYPVGFGGNFNRWLKDGEHKPYNSWGNGSAMRVSPIAWAFETEEEVLSEAKKSAECTHDHREGIKGAQAVALAIFLARKGATKEEIRARCSEMFNYDLSRTIEGIRPTYKFEVSCQKSVPEAIIAFLDSDSYEDTIRKAISLGGDADTQAAIAGSIAEAFYEKTLEEEVMTETLNMLPFEFGIILQSFNERFS